MPKQIIVLFLSLILSISSYAQVGRIFIGVNGLTCSQCSRTVELEIRKLPFVKDVRMALENTEGELTLNTNTGIDYAKIAKAIADAGFSVRFVDVEYSCTNTNITEGKCTDMAGASFVFLKPKTTSLNGTYRLQLLGSTFQPKKEAKPWLSAMKVTCPNNVKPWFVTIRK